MLIPASYIGAVVLKIQRITWKLGLPPNPEFGELVIGLSTDDNLEGRANDIRSLAHLSAIWKEFADHGLTTVSRDDPDQIIGVIIQYKPQTAENQAEN